MRTIVTIDQDLEVQIRRLMKERALSFKEALNSLIRAGLAVEAQASRPYVLPTRELGLRSDINLDKALNISAEFEDDQVTSRIRSAEGE